MKFPVLDEGFVVDKTGERGLGSIAVGSRCVVLPEGELLCSFMTTAGLGTNDFVPVLFRTGDGGKTWRDQGPVWPRLRERWSIFASISRDAAGHLYLFGSRSPIDKAGEPFWNDKTQGLKQNELIWSRSTDGGRTWSEPAVIPMPIAGAAEAPGALCITNSGRWLAPYSPYKTFDPDLRVDRNQVVVVFGDDWGRTWRHTSMLLFEDPASTAAEAWVIELRPGTLLGTCWHLGAGCDLPNAYAVSNDNGSSWSPTRSTGIMGQSTALAALPEGRALFVYNQRKHGEVGVWLAVAQPTAADFGVEANEIVWKAQTRTQSGTSGQHEEWEDFSFGEPSVTVLPDRSIFVTLWCLQPSFRGIRWLKLQTIE